MGFLNTHPDNVQSADFQAKQESAFSQMGFLVWDGIFTAISQTNTVLYVSIYTIIYLYYVLYELRLQIKPALFISIVHQGLLVFSI